MTLVTLRKAAQILGIGADDPLLLNMLSTIVEAPNGVKWSVVPMENVRNLAEVLKDTRKEAQ